jgi:hypothetical protein
MILLDSLFAINDFVIVPICFVVLLMFFSIIVKKYKDEKIKKLFIRAFFFKMSCTLLFAAVNTFYYNGGDSEMYYFCTQYLHQAVTENTDNFLTIYTTKAVNVKSSLMDYFIYRDTGYPVFEAMHDAGNFMVPKFGLPFMLLFGKSYIATAMFFSFFALGGAIRLFKFFYHYFPDYWREIALATLFLPSASYWSSGIMKDPICFGAVGYITYAALNIFILKRKYLSSILFLAVSAILLFYIKVYILLALSPGIVLWLFSELNKTVENKVLRGIMSLITFAGGAIMAVLLLNYVTSDESLKAFRLDAIVETSNYNRSLYEDFSKTSEGAYYSAGSSNPLLLIPNGIVATLFRPFLWEVNGATAFLSALEALFFFYLTLYFMIKKGFFTFFRTVFKSPVLLMCFVFSIVFAMAIGSTALNFGSLSRYKIPCLPFYLIMVMVMIRQAELPYPKWLKQILGYKVHFKPVDTTLAS